MRGEMLSILKKHIGCISAQTPILNIFIYLSFAWTPISLPGFISRPSGLVPLREPLE
jgi:hypothetical protein